MYCKYKNIFGKPNTGIHRYRIFNIAVADVIATIILAYVIHLYNPKYDVMIVLTILFISGIVLHRLFCVRTTIDKLLF